MSNIEEKSDSTFTFGDGVTLKSLKRVTIPGCVGGLTFDIVTDVVNCRIPLLLSKRAMKRGEMVIDFKNDVVFVRGVRIELISTSSGHYALPIVL